MAFSQGAGATPRGFIGGIAVCFYLQGVKGPYRASSDPTGGGTVFHISPELSTGFTKCINQEFYDYK